MKDPLEIWSRILRRSYSAVSTRSAPLASATAAADGYEDEAGNRRRGGRHSKTSYSLGLTGLVIIAVGMLMMFVQPYQMIFNYKILFGEGGEVFEMWRKPPVDLYLRVYLFNVTNADRFLAGKEKMRVQEVGPYVYRELMEHENVTFNDNGTLSAVPRHPLVWVPELSVGDQDTDQLVLPHIALLSITHVVADSSMFTRFGLNMLIRQTKTLPLVKMSPREFMFGYESTLLTIGNRFLSSWITFEKLGLIDRMYDFDGDYETVYTGEHDITRAGLLDTYNGATSIPQWESPCGDVRGASDGTKFASAIQPNDTLLFFRKSMCRAKRLVRVNSTISSGLKGYVYNFAEDADDNGLHDPDNACFCKKKKKCLPPGLLDVHECYYGFPIALSYPHFLDGDPSLLAYVDGMRPDVNRHKSHVVVQPESGLPLDVAVRYQINMALGDVSRMANVEKFADMVVPLLWTEIRLYGLPESLSARFNLYLNILPLVATGVMYVSFAMGACFVFLALHRLRRGTRGARLQHRVAWIDEETVVANQKVFEYLPNERRRRMSSKELEVYVGSLMAPLNQEPDHHRLGFEEFRFPDRGDDEDDDVLG